MLIVTEYLCDKWPRICSVCRNHNPVLSSCMTYHRMCSKSNMTGTTCGTTNPSGAHQFTRGTTYPSGAHQFTPAFSVIRVAQFLFFCAVFVYYCLSFFLWALQCLCFYWFTTADYPLVSSIYDCWLPFGIFYLRLLITPWYLLFTTADYPLVSSIYDYWLPFGIFYLRLLITLWYLLFTTADYPLVSSIYDWWLPFGIFKLVLMVNHYQV
jgi:hypothetical protein